jgi:hypothetical protein
MENWSMTKEQIAAELARLADRVHSGDRIFTASIAYEYPISGERGGQARVVTIKVEELVEERSAQPA